MKPLTEKRIAQFVLANQARILDFLKAIIECPSASSDAAGVNRIGEIISRAMPQGFEREVVQKPPYGNHLIFKHLRPPQIPVVLGGHMDTICPPGFDKLTREGNRLRGPGTADMKGGLVVMIWALKTLEECGLLEQLPVICIFNADEEVNSPTSRDIFKGMHGKAAAGLVFECAGMNNSAVTTRRGIAIFDLTIKGKPGHAGLYQGAKSNAILEAAHKVIQIEAMNRPDQSIATHVGIIQGGEAYNAIPKDCRMTIDLRCWDPAIGEQAEAQLHRIAGATIIPGCATTMVKRTFRPPMRPDAAAQSLFELARKIAAELGQQLPPEERGGGSDASWLAHVGIPSLDGLGPIGANDFTDQEYILESSLFERISLVANLLLNLNHR